MVASLGPLHGKALPLLASLLCFKFIFYLNIRICYILSFSYFLLCILIKHVLLGLSPCPW